MSWHDLIWYSASKDDVPALAFGEVNARGGGSPTPDDLLGAGVTVGYSREGVQSRDYYPPSLFVLRDKEIPEVLSWLKVYAPESFPLSQFARVISNDDWKAVKKYAGSEVDARADRWACVVLGEILAQGEIDTDVSSVPLSRASACFSTAIARADMAYGRSELLKICSERLRSVEADSRFLRRQVVSTELHSIWALISADVGIGNHIRDIVELVLSAAASYATGVDGGRIVPKISGFPELFGDSAEERVLAFQRLVKALDVDLNHGSSKQLAAATLAAGAFLVGRGTSHSFLLRKSPIFAPLAFVWFGLMASLLGANGWDTQWSRAVKGVERQLRGKLRLDEPSVCDICWMEYAWLSQTFSGIQVLSEVARLAARTLSIEIVPGAVCQFRLAIELKIAEPEQRARPDNSVREIALKSALEQFLRLADRTHHLLERGEVSGGGKAQASLPFNEQQLEKKRLPAKAGRSRRPAKKPSE
ncbi:hypothetical protein [Xanthomonas sp. 4461]|uniref:hypothetical protein n=1 Tax=Xanthomonas sp. 4461 TaxID=3035313 RepID=UPI002167C1D0|nr:hypothetical protein [Xanthomonas sp. 4461]MCS3810503.1 hypothetical protein [Xanthomonas sp. 4461]